MKKIKGLSAILAVLLAIVIILTACAGTASTGNNGTGNSNTENNITENNSTNAAVGNISDSNITSVDVGNTSSNLEDTVSTGVHNYQVLSHDGWIYYIPNSISDYIWRMREDGSRNEVASEEDVSGLWYVEGDILYSGHAELIKLFKIGEELELTGRLGDRGSDAYCDFTERCGDYFYAMDTDNFVIIRQDTDRGKITTISDENKKAVGFDVYNNEIYVAFENDGIYRYDIEMTTPTLILEGTYYNLTVYNDVIYYLTEDDGLYAIPCEGGKETNILPADTTFSYNIADDEIYYFNKNDAFDYYHQSLYRVQTDGKNNTKILDGSLLSNDYIISEYGVDIVDGMLYFAAINNDFCRCDKNGENIEVIWSENN